ncbi:MAG: hypothetical protein RIR43_515 [Pseudomonadota bacterium]
MKPHSVSSPPAGPEGHPRSLGMGMPWTAAPLADGVGGVRWVMRRNCSLAPRQLFAAYCAICLVSLSIAVVFAWFGAVPVLYFAGLELALLGLALLVYARHAADHETITLKNSTLAVEHHCGSRVERAEFRADWLRVEPAQGQGSLLELSGAGRRTFVGRYLRPEWRQMLARELRQALRLHGTRPALGEVMN